MSKLFPIRNRSTFAIRLCDGDLFTYDDGKVAIGSKSYLKMLMNSVPIDFSSAKIIKVKPAVRRAKNKA